MAGLIFLKCKLLSLCHIVSKPSDSWCIYLSVIEQHSGWADISHLTKLLSSCPIVSDLSDC